MGVTISEQSAVIGLEPGRVQTPHGTVRAPLIVRATEGFTASLPGLKRQWIPMNSAMLITEPLPDALWDSIGWRGCELVSDSAHAYGYAQRTREGRIALGGRGVPYRFGSATDVQGVTQQATMERLQAMLLRWFPQAQDLRIDHAWCGVLGPRQRHGLGGRLCGPGRIQLQPGRPHFDRFAAGARHRFDAPALGKPPSAPLGARAFALAGHPRHVQALPLG
jgi:glycine/D-amino acid oxidase-like deaminating enzyme